MSWLRRKKAQADQIVKDLDDLEQAEKKALDSWEDNLAHRAPAEVPGIDISAITAADPGFNDQDFLAIARESFYDIRRARTADESELAEGLMSPQLLAELGDAIHGDVAAHRHHLLPGLEVEHAVITAAQVVDGKLEITVRLHIWCGEENPNPAAGVEVGAQWDEDWTLWRDPTIDASATDHEHTLRRAAEGGWMFAHKGWIVTSIERAGADATAG